MTQIKVVKSEKISVELLLNDKLFKEQRKTLTSIICSACDLDNIFTEEEIDVLCGIQALLDEIADQAHDNYGMDTLFLDEDGESV